MRDRHKNKRLEEQIKELTDPAPKKRVVTVGRGEMIDHEIQTVSIRKTPILWGIPCDELGYSGFWIHFMRHSNWMPWDGFAGSEGTYLPKARNVIHNAFLESSLDYLMMLDSDILFPTNIADRLIAHKLPIVGGWYKDKKANDHHPVVFDFVREDENGVAVWTHRDKPGQGVERVDATGAGAWLMSRDVAEALGKNPYHMNSGGEDMVLCRKLMELNIPLYVDWSLACAHTGVGFV